MSQPLSIDVLPVQKSLIDLSTLPKNTFGSAFVGYDLKQVLDDVLLVKYVDEADDGFSVIRGGLHIPVNAETRAWRVGKVLLAGPTVKYAKVGDVVIFPHNLGIPISNLDLAEYGNLKSGVFLNEVRIFGICSVRDDSAAITGKKKKA